MDYKDLIKLIEKYNLAIRRIPDKIINLYDMRHYKDGDELYLSDITGKQYVQRVRIPKYAGWYLVKEVNSTGSIVKWDIKKDNLAETLEESINLFISKL